MLRLRPELERSNIARRVEVELAPIDTVECVLVTISLTMLLLAAHDYGKGRV